MFLRDLTVLTYDSRWTWDHVTSHTVLESMSIHVWIFTRRLGHYFSRYNLCVTLTYQQNGNWDSVTEYLSKAPLIVVCKISFLSNKSVYVLFWIPPCRSTCMNDIQNNWNKDEIEKFIPNFFTLYGRPSMDRPWEQIALLISR